jgi:PadR family transcriptional regulator PadR
VKGPERTTRQTLAILEVLLRDPMGWWYGLELSKATGLQSGTVYPALGRLHRRWGWLESQWEDAEPSGRPPRRLYRLTGAGERAARELLAEHGAVVKAPDKRSPAAPAGRTVPA